MAKKIRKKIKAEKEQPMSLAAHYIMMEEKETQLIIDSVKEDIIARCTRCSNEFTEKDIEKATACPSCGTKSIPLNPNEDISIKINWHELRILCIWAENWARHCDKDKKDDMSYETMLSTIMIIAERLQKQFPDKICLTLFSEIRTLRSELAKTGTEVVTDLDDDEKLGL
jgi:Zn finger protein HypA/HybF involved in hydrogenase expression